MTGPQPVLRLVRGDASAEELAALVAVLAAAGGGPTAPPAPGPRPRWNDPARLLGLAPAPGPGAWRAGSGPR